MGFWVASTRKGDRQKMGLLTYGDLTFLHGFQQGALDLGRCPVDLVRQHNIGKNRPFLGGKRALARIVNQRSDEVGGQEVRGKLEPLKAGADCLSQGLHRQGLGQTGDAFQQDMPVRQQPDNQAVYEILLTNNDLADSVS